MMDLVILAFIVIQLPALLLILISSFTKKKYKTLSEILKVIAIIYFLIILIGFGVCLGNT